MGMNRFVCALPSLRTKIVGALVVTYLGERKHAIVRGGRTGGAACWLGAKEEGGAGRVEPKGWTCGLSEFGEGMTLGIIWEHCRTLELFRDWKPVSFLPGDDPARTVAEGSDGIGVVVSERGDGDMKITFETSFGAFLSRTSPRPASAFSASGMDTRNLGVECPGRVRGVFRELTAVRRRGVDDTRSLEVVGGVRGVRKVRSEAMLRCVLFGESVELVAIEGPSTLVRFRGVLLYSLDVSSGPAVDRTGGFGCA